MVTVLVQSSTSEWQEKAEKVRHELKALDIKIVDMPPAHFKLSVSEAIVIEDSSGLKWSIDFDNDKSLYHFKNPLQNNILLKALGLKPSSKNIIYDLSVGMARDAVMLAQIGFQVVGVERNALLYYLLNQALLMSQRQDLKRLQFRHAQSLQFLENLKITENMVFYFDPMFPETKKSALPKKEMQIFRKLVGSDEDAVEVLLMAQKKKLGRLIVKRPLRALALGQDLSNKNQQIPDPQFSISGKLIRYDVYLF